jgi:hypothetical protein
MKCCPHCKRPYPPDLMVHGPLRRRIIEILGSHPEGLTRGQLFDLAYADDPDGGPDNTKGIRVSINQINRELAPQGWQIKSDYGRGALYKLVKIDARSKQQSARNNDARAVERSKPAIA